MLETVPPPLRDRMEVLNLHGYTSDEKLAIARRYLIPRQCTENGIKPDDIGFEDSAVSLIISGYTREAGLRNLEREIAKVCRKVALRRAEGDTTKVSIGPEKIPEFLGPERFTSETAERTGQPGVAIGLAWTPYGGEILFVEATGMPGSGGLILTGQLGDVMRESALAAMSFIRSRAADLGIAPRRFAESDIHVHVPAGAIPKDGPSAGITIAAAITSFLTGRACRPDTAMTGEITLRGKVLPIGGLKEKLLAARRAGITRVIYPAGNQKDLHDVPSEVIDGLTLQPARTVDEALQAALLPGPGPAQRRAAGARPRGQSARRKTGRKRPARRAGRTVSP
jgi:ATP-dependent Lon protease